MIYGTFSCLLRIVVVAILICNYIAALRFIPSVSNGYSHNESEEHLLLSVLELNIQCTTDKIPRALSTVEHSQLSSCQNCSFCVVFCPLIVLNMYCYSVTSH